MKFLTLRANRIILCSYLQQTVVGISNFDGKTKGLKHKENETKHEHTCVTYEQLNVTIIHAYIDMDLKLRCLLLYRRTATYPNIVHSFMKYNFTIVIIEFTFIQRKFWDLKC